MIQGSLLSADGQRYAAWQHGIGDAGTPGVHVVKVDWPHPSTRRIGTAVIRIPRSFREVLQALDPYGGTWVRLTHEALGDWTGRLIAEPPRVSETHVELTVRQLPAILQGQPLTSGQRFRFTPAGLIAQAAITLVATKLGNGVIRAGTFTMAPPLIPDLTFDGQDCLGLLYDLAQQTGQEFEVTADGEVNWLPEASGSLYPRILGQDADLVYLSETADVSNRVSEVLPVDRMGRHYAPITAGDLLLEEPRRAIVRVQSASSGNAIATARAYLAAHRTPVITYQLGLLPGDDVTAVVGGGGGSSDLYRLARKLPGVLVEAGGIDVTHAPHWRAVREGDLIMYSLPGARPLGASPGAFGIGRVLSREFGDDHPYPLLTVHELQPWDATTIAASIERFRPQYVVPDAWNRRVAVGGVAGALGPGGAFIQVYADQVQGQLTAAQISGTFTEEQIPALPVSHLTGVTVDETDLNKLGTFTGAGADLEKTTVAAWAGGATANPQQTGVGAPAAKGAESIVLTQASIQAAFDSLVAYINTTTNPTINGVRGVLSGSGISS